MDASEQFAFPTPQPQDSEEVREAIEKAGVLWAEDPKESLKWLRQAAEVASDAGDDMRSLQLAKVSADLRNLANISPSVPPQATLPPISVRLPPSAAAPVNGSGDTAGVFGPTAGVEATKPSADSVSATGEHSIEAPQSGERTTPGETSSVWASGENNGVSAGDFTSDEPADQHPTPNAPMVDAPLGDAARASGHNNSGHNNTAATGASGIAQVEVTPPSASEAFSIPQVSFSKDPGQTLPATPAATAAAAALATAPVGHQAMSASPSNAPPGLAGNGAAGGFGARPTPGFMGSAGANFGAARPEQPTLVGRPLQGSAASPQGLGGPGSSASPFAGAQQSPGGQQVFTPGPRGVNDQTPAATPAAIQADSVAPNSATRFVQHRAVEVAISIAPNAGGHFDLHPLAEGEKLEPGFRRALLVALAPEDRLFPGRG